MKVFIHHIYEFQKGLRNLVLHTLDSSQRMAAEQKLQQMGIAYVVREVTPEKVNIFFGSPESVAVIRSFGPRQLYDLSPEEDFMLGIMLGYDRNRQCQRYLQMVSKFRKCG